MVLALRLAQDVNYPGFFQALTINAVRPVVDLVGKAVGMTVSFHRFEQGLRIGALRRQRSKAVVLVVPEPPGANQDKEQYQDRRPLDRGVDVGLPVGVVEPMIR